MASESGEPEVVYHYTTMDTLLKIVDSKVIWATSIEYLNDTSEGKHFVSEIRRRLPYYLEQHNLETRYSEVFDGSDEFRFFETKPYVASFSTESDSLPQWRSYCPKGNGVAIGFRVECLKRVTFALDQSQEKAKMAVSFLPVEYIDANRPDSVIDDEIGKAMKSVDTLRLFAGQLKDHPVLGRESLFRVLVEQQASSKKHRSFENEREYRLVINPGWIDPELLEFRSVRSTLVPYVPLLIPEKQTGYEQKEWSRGVRTSLYEKPNRFHFIDRVVIGPTSNGDLSEQALSAFFRKHKMHVAVLNSEIPFRDW